MKRIGKVGIWTRQENWQCANEKIKKETNYVYCTYKRAETVSIFEKPTGSVSGRDYLCAHTQK